MFPPRTAYVYPKDPSLILGSLERALCNLADLGRSLMELQRSSKLFRIIPYFLPIFPLSLSIEFPTMRILT